MLADQLYEAFEDKCDFESLNESIKKRRSAVDLALPANKKFYERLLGISLLGRCWSTSSEDGMNEGAELVEQVLRSSERNNSPFYPDTLSTAAATFIMRFRLTKNMEDIDKAFDYCQEGLELDEKDYDKCWFLQKLSTAFRERGEVLRSATDLDKSIKRARECLTFMKDNQKLSAVIGGGLRSKYVSIRYLYAVRHRRRNGYTNARRSHRSGQNSG